MADMRIAHGSEGARAASLQWIDGFAQQYAALLPLHATGTRKMAQPEEPVRDADPAVLQPSTGSRLRDGPSLSSRRATGPSGSSKSSPTVTRSSSRSNKKPRSRPNRLCATSCEERSTPSTCTACQQEGCRAKRRTRCCRSTASSCRQGRPAERTRPSRYSKRSVRCSSRQSRDCTATCAETSQAKSMPRKALSLANRASLRTCSSRTRRSGSRSRWVPPGRPR